MKFSPFRRVFLAALAAAIASLALPAVAAQPGIQLNAQQKEVVRKVEAYLNGITTLQSTFFQQSSTNEVAEGEIFLQRPGKLRIEYKPPAAILIVAAGKYLSYLDKQINQISHIPVEDTPAAFLLSAKIDLGPERVAYHEVVQDGGTIFVTVSDRRDAFAGRLTLVFRAQPLSLRKWSVTDAQGIITDIVLTDAFFGGTLDPKLFDTPEPAAQPARE